MSVTVQCFAEDEAHARRLADALGVACHVVGVHTFPDGETLPTVAATAGPVIAYCPLNRPNEKLVKLILACDAWRRGGANRLVLVAPYMAYLRQDAVFAAGQAVSRDVIGRLLGARFDHIVTVEPHLHRTSDLGPIFAPATVEVLTAGADLALAIGPRDDPLIVGPDEESEPWARAVAKPLGAAFAVLRKVRHGDRCVDLALPDHLAVTGRRVVLVDDICSSGGTLEAAASRMTTLGAARVDVAVVHALHTVEAAERLTRAGVTWVLSTTSCPHPTNVVDLTPRLAAALRKELLA